MRSYVFLVVAILLAGCSDATPTESPDEATPAPINEPDDVPSTPSGPVTITLVDERVTIPANTCTPTSQQHDLMHEVDVTNETLSLDTLFTRINQPQGLFATNIRAYGPGGDPSSGGMQEQAAWGSDGTIEFSFPSPEPGTWSFWLLHCDVPDGEHVIDSVITIDASA